MTGPEQAGRWTLTGRRLAVVGVGVTVLAAGAVVVLTQKSTPSPVKSTLPASTTTAKPRPKPRPKHVRPVKLAPLTGLPEPSVAAQKRCAITVKIGNTPQARPQYGVEQADVVYEEVVEGGITRLAAVFQCRRPTGSVRSARCGPPTTASSGPSGASWPSRAATPSRSTPSVPPPSPGSTRPPRGRDVPRPHPPGAAQPLRPRRPDVQRLWRPGTAAAVPVPQGPRRARRGQGLDREHRVRAGLRRVVGLGPAVAHLEAVDLRRSRRGRRWRPVQRRQRGGHVGRLPRRRRVRPTARASSPARARSRCSPPAGSSPAPGCDPTSTSRPGCSTAGTSRSPSRRAAPGWSSPTPPTPSPPHPDGVVARLRPATTPTGR